MVQSKAVNKGWRDTTRYPADNFGVKPSEPGLPTGIGR